MKDEHWVDSIRPKQHTTTFTDSIYEGMSDESLLDMKQKVNAEWDRRQQERFAMILKIRRQLHSHMDRPSKHNKPRNREQGITR